MYVNNLGQKRFVPEGEETMCLKDVVRTLKAPRSIIFSYVKQGKLKFDKNSIHAQYMFSRNDVYRLKNELESKNIVFDNIFPEF